MPLAETVDDNGDKTDKVVILCTLEDVEFHLRAFIVAFVLPRAQPRWLEFLIEKRSDKTGHTADAVLRRFAVDEKCCTRIPNSKRTTANFEATFGKGHGIYFELQTPPCKMTAMQAEEKFSWEDSCAILSYEAGKKAIFFLHSRGVWVCEKV